MAMVDTNHDNNNVNADKQPQDDNSMTKAGDEKKQEESTTTTTTTTAAESTTKRKQLDLTKLGLYGRERELKVLKVGLNKIVKQHAKQQQQQLQQQQQHNTKISSIPTQVVWIEGTSGSGKSALAQQLKPQTQQQGCFFVQGKIDMPHAHQTGTAPKNYPDHDDDETEDPTETSDDLKSLSTALRHSSKSFVGSHHSSSSNAGSSRKSRRRTSSSYPREPARRQSTVALQGIRLALGTLCHDIMNLPRRSGGGGSGQSGASRSGESASGGETRSNGDNPEDNPAHSNHTKKDLTIPICYEDAQELLKEGLPKGSMDVLEKLVPNLSLIVGPTTTMTTEALAAERLATSPMDRRTVPRVRARAA
mmetsp:Transcript_1953/g.4708  ORF Transcript_1953/g.4708 Transcript_1953/m.4708 type:complete len:363 (+) Transcript_1953:71-1159(+)